MTENVLLMPSLTPSRTTSAVVGDLHFAIKLFTFFGVECVDRSSKPSAFGLHCILDCTDRGICIEQGPGILCEIRDRNGAKYVCILRFRIRVAKVKKCGTNHSKADRKSAAC